MNDNPLLPLDRLPEQTRLLIQRKLLELLAQRSRAYTRGDSGSLPQELAQELLDGLYYVLGRYVKQRQLPPEQLAAANFELIFSLSVTLIRQQVEAAKQLYAEVCSQLPPLRNVYLEETVRDIAAFFRAYDPLFFAQQIPCSIDYPLADPLPDTLAGVDFITAYLTRLRTENRLLRCFPPRELHALLHRCRPEYEGLLFNLYEPAAINALGCALLGRPPRPLSLAPAEQEQLHRLFCTASPQKAAEQLEAAAGLLSSPLPDASEQQDCLLRTARRLYPRLAAAVLHGGWEEIFISC